MLKSITIGVALTMLLACAGSEPSPCTMAFTITMENGAQVGNDACVRTELEMKDGEIISIHIWPAEGPDYFMRIPEQGEMESIGHRAVPPSVDQ